MRKLVFFISFILLQALSCRAQAPGSVEESFPVGLSDHEIEGLQVTVDVPAGLSAETPGSLVILLHGAGGLGKRLMTELQGWTAQKFVVCAPQATEAVWSKKDLEAVEKIGLRLLKSLPIKKDGVHVMGFSNGAWNLPALAFSDSLHPVSSVFIGAGYQDGSPPKWAALGHAVLALAGAEDPNLASTLAVEDRLAGKVRSVETRIEPDLGHRWTRKFTPYMLWWQGIQEGRFQYGQSLVFDWQNNLDQAIASQADEKVGGVLAYVYDSRKEDEEALAKNIEVSVFFDKTIRFYVGQLAAVEFDLAMKTPPFAMKETPCVVILDKSGKIKKSFEKKVDAKSLRRTLGSLVASKKLPKR